MGWASALRGIGSGLRAGLGSKLGSISSSIGKWLSGTKLSSWLKVGAAGGVGAVIYGGWNSAIASISDATGLSEDNVSTIVLLILGCLVVYIAVSLIRPKNGSGGDVTIYVPETRDSRSRSSGSSGNMSSRSSSKNSKSRSSRTSGRNSGRSY